MRAWLSRSGVEHEARDFFQEPFSEPELRELIAGRPVSLFFSWASPSFRKLGLERHGLTDDQLIAMMLEEPRLIRRPLIVVDGELLEPTSGADKIVRLLEERIG